MSTQTIEYGYADGSANTIRPTSVRYPDGRVVSYDYGATDGADDRLSRPAAVKSDGDPVAEYAYLGGGTFVQTRYPEPQVAWDLATGSGANPYAGLNRFGRVIDNRWLKTGNSSSSSSGDSGDVDRIQYGYDRASNRTWRKNVVAREQYSGGNDELYAYDGVQRLQQLLRGDLNGTNTAIDDLTFAEKWGLDATGNWNRYKQDEDGSGWSLNQRREANQANEITEIAGGSWVVPEYDAAGNTVLIPKPADPTSAYEAYYDAWNRLVRLEDGSETVAQYAYDGLHRRITVDDGEAVRHAYFSQEWQVLEERLDASEEAERQFVWGLRYIDDLILRDRSVGGILEERLYALQDANWNVTAVVDPAGDVQERYAYSAYGIPQPLYPHFTPKSWSDFDWESLYAGYRSDQSTGLYQVRFRMLHPLIGQWVIRDPLTGIDGPNIYAYVTSDPINWIDWLGLSKCKSHEECAGQFIGIVIRYSELKLRLLRYNPVRDALGGDRNHYTGEPTKPGGHYEQIRIKQAGLQSQIDRYIKDCIACSCSDGPRPRLPSAFVALAVQDVIPPIYLTEYRNLAELLAAAKASGAFPPPVSVPAPPRLAPNPSSEGLLDRIQRVFNVLRAARGQPIILVFPESPTGRDDLALNGRTECDCEA